MLQALLLMLATVLIGFGLHAAIYIFRRRRAQKPSPPSVSGRVVMYGLFMLVGIGFGLFGWNIAVSAQDETSDWPSAEGTITSFLELDETVIYDRGFSFSGNVTDPLHPVLLSYEYKVDDTSYVGDKIFADEHLNDGFHEFEEQELEEYRKKYPEGQAVDILYNPDDPSQAALEITDNTGLTVLGIGAGVLFGIVTGVFAFPIAQYTMNPAKETEDTNDY